MGPMFAEFKMGNFWNSHRQLVIIIDVGVFIDYWLLIIDDW